MYMTFAAGMARATISVSPFWPCRLGRVRFLYMFRFSTTTRSLSFRTALIVPVLPRSLPNIICTWSPFLNFIMLNDFLGEGYYFLETFLLELLWNRAKDAGGDGLVFRVDKHHRVLVETDVGTVLAAGVPRSGEGGGGGKGGERGGP